MKTPFVHKLIDHLDKIEKSSLEKHLRNVASTSDLLYQILNTLDVGILLCTKNLEIEYYNEKARSILDLPLLSEDSFPVDKAIEDEALKRFIHQLAKKSPVRLREKISVLLPREMVLEVIAGVVPRNTNYFFCQITDITHSASVANFESRWNQFQSLLHLASGIAHEIGNPLNSIGIHLELMRKQIGHLTPKQKGSLTKILTVIDNETKRLDQIVKNFLKATRKSPVRFKLENLNAIVEEAVVFMQEELNQSKISVDIRKSRKIPNCLVDRDRLHQAFLNILINAKEAMSGGGHIQVSISQRGKIITVRFKDTGCGIPKDTLPLIFDPYFTTKNEGSGLGLSSVLETMRDHGGRVDVASRPKKGTTVTLTFPVRLPKLQISYQKS